MHRTGACLGLAAALVGAPVFAQTQPLEPRVDWTVDSIVTGAGVGVTFGASFIPVDRSRRWHTELLPFDCSTRRAFSSSAADWSNGLLLVTLTAPMALQVGAGLDEAAGKRLLVYGETLSLTLALSSVTKFLVARPRPYVYSSDPRVSDYARRQGKDSHLSFFSGHSALAFAAAVAGSYLFTQTSRDRAARAGIWGTELFLAATTATLRVRAGQHFPSDVLVGALVGAGFGLAVPSLHYAGRHPRGLSAAEWVAVGVGPSLGALTGAFVPFPHDVLVPLDARLAPWVTERGAGLAFAGEW
jgi:membrane-associated phospholipid phosphatase